jgi:hypothetical protein
MRSICIDVRAVVIASAAVPTFILQRVVKQTRKCCMNRLLMQLSNLFPSQYRFWKSMLHNNFHDIGMLSSTIGVLHKLTVKLAGVSITFDPS